MTQGGLGSTPGKEHVTAVVLAGGRAQRMGGVDKGLVRLAGRPLVAWVSEALRAQAHVVVINANRNLAQYREHADIVIPDARSGFLGPLAGMAAAMTIAETDYVCTAPCDSPFVPPDLVRRLLAAVVVEGADIACAADSERLQPVFSLIPTRCVDDLNAFLDDGERKIDRWFERHRCTVVDFSDHPHAFLNINTVQDRARIEQQLRVAGP